MVVSNRTSFERIAGLRFVSQASFDSDLYRPSLTARDDADGFDHPWNPMALAIISFFAGLPAGGGLLTVNFWRLGMRSWAIPSGVFVVVASLAIYVGSTFFDAVYNKSGDDDWWLNLTPLGANVIIALAMVRMQRRRYRLAEMADIPKGELLWPAVIAVSLGVATRMFLWVGTRMMAQLYD